MNDWVECWNCEDGYSHHDCGEDCCCCLDPEPNIVCDICKGKGGWFLSDLPENLQDSEKVLENGRKILKKWGLDNS